MKAAAVIAAMDETETLALVLAECRRLPLSDVVVVANGPGAGAARVASAHGVRVLRYPERLGHDVGRALGSLQCPGSAVLFLDADLPIPAGALLHFVQAAEQGVDVALNRIDPHLHPYSRLHPVNAAKRFLNCAAGRPDLGCASLTAIPHALSPRALRELPPETLAVPPLAQVQAIALGLRVEAVFPVDVVAPNPRRPGLNTGRFSPVEQLILGDHLEALNWLLCHSPGPRGRFPDLGRRRDLLPGAGDGPAAVRPGKDGAR